MEEMIFNHMKIIRNVTLEAVADLTEEDADYIPEGFNNNIRWNLGHIVFIQERVVFNLLGGGLGVPKLYKFLFAPGTSPDKWEFPTPTMDELKSILADQPKRIEEFLAGRVDQKLDPPFTNGMGLTFHTIGESLLFSIYHEGLHMQAIKQIKMKLEQRNTN